MFYSKNREQLKPKFIDLAQDVSFFTIAGGALGAIFGGSAGLMKGVPLRTILPHSIFKSSIFFTTISAINGALEIARDKKDAINPLLAGGWTGFIFGHGLTKKLHHGLSLGLKGAILTWAIHSFTIPGIYKYLQKSIEAFDPFLTKNITQDYGKRIENLRAEIQYLKTQK